MKFVTVALVVGLLGSSASAQAATTSKIGMAHARAIALKAAPGKIVDAEYEKEAGGWRYSFDIRQGKRIHEIGVDAFTGRILEDKFEGPGSRD